LAVGVGAVRASADHVEDAARIPISLAAAGAGPRYGLSTRRLFSRFSSPRTNGLPRTARCSAKVERAYMYLGALVRPAPVVLGLPKDQPTVGVSGREERDRTVAGADVAASRPTP
jgi:hypothetical protein